MRDCKFLHFGVVGRKQYTNGERFRHAIKSAIVLIRFWRHAKDNFLGLFQRILVSATFNVKKASIL